MRLFLCLKGDNMAYREERIKEYERDLRNLRRRLSNAEDDHERSILGSMIGSTEYALFWLRNRHERLPGETYKENKLNYMQRTQLWGNVDHAVCYHNVDVSNKAHLAPCDTFSMAVEDFLSLLSKREREAFLLTKSALYTHEEAAEAMNVSLGTVKQYTSRAKEKIENAKKYGMQVTLQI